MSTVKPFPNEKAKAALGRASGLPGNWKRIGAYLCMGIVIFLAGFVPAWIKLSESDASLGAAEHNLLVSHLENDLAGAALDARRGDYEPARAAASSFFTTLRSLLDDRDDSVLTRSERDVLAPLLQGRDEIITLLARSDPASADRLSDLYAAFRRQLAGVGQNGK